MDLETDARTDHDNAMPDQQVHTRSQVYWNTLLKIPTQAAVFVVSVLVTRILTPADYGILGVAMVLIGYANLFTDFGFSAAIVQKQIRDDDTLRSIFTFNLAVSAALALAFSLSAGLIADFFKSAECRNVIVVMSSIFVITSFSAVPRAMLNRDLDFKTLSLIDTASAVVTSLLTLGLALAHYGYWALALGQLIPSILFTVYVCIRVGWTPGVAYRHSSMRQVLDFGFWNVLKTQLEFALGHVDKVFLGRYAGMVNLGYYDKALSIASVPSGSFIASLNAVLFSSFSQRRDDREDVRELLRKGLMTISVLSFPVYVGLLVVAGPFVVGLLGAKWSPMIAPFQIIAFAFTVKSILGFLVAVNVAVGQYRAYTIRYALAGLLLRRLVRRAGFLRHHRHRGGVPPVRGALRGAWPSAGGRHSRPVLVGGVLGACWPATKATLCMLAVDGAPVVSSSGADAA